MKKIAIVYASIYHGNTFKLINGIAEELDISLIDATKNKIYELNDYEYIGFASGIDFGEFYKSVQEFMITNLPENKKVFFLFTCAKVNQSFTKSIQSIALSKKAIILGGYGCKGYNNYGPLKLIGGMNKDHPTKHDIKCAIEFIKNLQNMN